jgi:hypothetical protein
MHLGEEDEFISKPAQAAIKAAYVGVVKSSGSFRS